MKGTLHRYSIWMSVCDFRFRFSRRYLVCFLSKVAANADVNKMSSSNIAIVIAPNIIWDKSDESG